MPYLTEAEIKMAQTLPRDMPYVIENVSQTIFSTARHFGSMTFMGKGYDYIIESDELIRWDVLDMVQTARRKAATEARKAAKAQWQEKQQALL